MLGAIASSPQHPFGNPALVVIDSMRLVCLVAGLVMILIFVRILVNIHGRNIQPWYPWGAWSIMLLGSASVYTEFIRLGDHLTPRIFLNLTGLLLACKYLKLLLDQPFRDRPSAERHDPFDDAPSSGSPLD